MAEISNISFILTGQLPSGKNQIKISYIRGKIHKYPEERFVTWRNKAWAEIREQLGHIYYMVELPARITVRYWWGDLRTRDVPGMMDAICHLLEWCPTHGRGGGCCRLSFVKNDSLLSEWHWLPQELDRQNPRAEINIELRNAIDNHAAVC